MKTIQLLGMALIMAVSCANRTPVNTIDTTTVKHLELEKYLGTWYEIARFPHSFEKGLVGVTRGIKDHLKERHPGPRAK